MKPFDLTADEIRLIERYRADKAMMEGRPQARATMATNMIERDFSYHKPSSEIGLKIQANRDLLRYACSKVLADIPAGREASIVKTKLEEAMFWASAALARPPLP